MPTYDYVCKECGYVFEEFQPMSADPLLNCPQCGKDSLKRKMGTGAGMIFKGNGFYLTDYKKGNASSSSESSRHGGSSSPKTEPSITSKEVTKTSSTSSESSTSKTS